MNYPAIYGELQTSVLVEAHNCGGSGNFLQDAARNFIYRLRKALSEVRTSIAWCPATRTGGRRQGEIIEKWIVKHVLDSSSKKEKTDR